MAIGAGGQGDKQVLGVREVGHVKLTEDMPAVGHEFARGIAEESGHVADGFAVGILCVSVVGLCTVLAEALQVGLHPDGLTRSGKGVLLFQELGNGIGLVLGLRPCGAK